MRFPLPERQASLLTAEEWEWGVLKTPLPSLTPPFVSFPILGLLGSEAWGKFTAPRWSQGSGALYGIIFKEDLVRVCSELPRKSPGIHLLLIN